MDCISQIDCILEGSSSLEVQECNEVVGEVSGASYAQFVDARSIHLEVYGASKAVICGELDVKTFNVSISGSSRVTAFLPHIDNLDAEINGASSFNLSKRCTVNSKEIKTNGFGKMKYF